MDLAILMRRTKAGALQGLGGSGLVGGQRGVEERGEDADPGGDLLGQAGRLTQRRGHDGRP